MNWFHNAMNAKRFEPQKRKHGSLVPEWVGHRFPVKDGISLNEVMIRNFTAHNALIKIFETRQ